MRGNSAESCDVVGGIVLGIRARSHDPWNPGNLLESVGDKRGKIQTESWVRYGGFQV